MSTQKPTQGTSEPLCDYDVNDDDMFDGCQGRKQARKGEVAASSCSQIQVIIFAMTMVTMIKLTTLSMMGNKQIFPKSENLFRQWLVANRAPPTVKIVEEHFYGGLSVSALNMMVKLGRYWRRWRKRRVMLVLPNSSEDSKSLL